MHEARHIGPTYKTHELHHMSFIWCRPDMRACAGRPLLCILDREVDMVTMLNHSWTYQAPIRCFHVAFPSPSRRAICSRR